MTTLKTPRLCTRKGIHTCRPGSVHVNEKDKEVLEQHNQATINLLCELLEKMKDLEGVGDLHRVGWNNGIQKAQALIRQTLDLISNQE